MQRDFRLEYGNSSCFLPQLEHVPYGAKSICVGFHVYSCVFVCEGERETDLFSNSQPPLGGLSTSFRLLKLDYSM